MQRVECSRSRPVASLTPSAAHAMRRRCGPMSFCSNSARWREAALHERLGAVMQIDFGSEDRRSARYACSCDQPPLNSKSFIFPLALLNPHERATKRQLDVSNSLEMVRVAREEGILGQSLPKK